MFDWVGKAANWVSDAGSSFLDHYYNDPADAQKKGLKQLGADWTQFGQNQRDWYGTQGANINQTFDQTGQDINTLRNSDPTSRLASLWDQANGQSSADAAYDTGHPIGSYSRLAQPPPDGYHAPGDASPHEARDYYQQLQGDPSLRPTEQQDYYTYLNGTKGNLTNQEELYNERKGGNDPAASYQDSRATDAINRQLAARGGYNTGAGGRQISDYYANANAQRSEQLAGLAAGADTSRLGVNNALGGAAQGASGEQDTYSSRLGNAAQGASTEEANWNAYKEGLGKDLGDQVEKHLNDVIGADQNLAGAKSAVQEKLTELGGQAMSDAQKESFAAQLASLGVDPQKIKDILGMFGGVIQGGAKLAAA